MKDRKSRYNLTTFPVSKESFENLLEDDVFVDYLNKFLALPVFGQRVVYRKKHDIFLFEPPLPEQEDFKEMVQL